MLAPPATLALAVPQTPLDREMDRHRIAPTG